MELGLGSGLVRRVGDAPCSEVTVLLGAAGMPCRVELAMGVVSLASSQQTRPLNRPEEGSAVRGRDRGSNVFEPLMTTGMEPRSDRFYPRLWRIRVRVRPEEGSAVRGRCQVRRSLRV